MAVVSKSVNTRLLARFYSETIKGPLREAMEEGTGERAGRNGARRGTGCN